MEYRDFLEAEIGWGNIWGNKLLGCISQTCEKIFVVAQAFQPVPTMRFGARREPHCVVSWRAVLPDP
jgi:hypothetical protein